MSTTPLSSIAPTSSVPASSTNAAPTGGFSRVLDSVLGNANQADAAASQAIQELATGEANDLHTAALAVAQADLTFRLALEIRNRLLDAYQEVTRMQV